MMRCANYTLLPLAVVSMLACGDNDLIPSSDENPPRDATQSLKQGVDFSSDLEASSVHLGVTWNRGNDDTVTDTLSVGLKAGQIGLSIDDEGVLFIDGMDLEVGDIVAHADALPHPVQLTNVRLQQELKAIEVLSTQWEPSGDAIHAETEIDLVLNWDLVDRNGVPRPLGEQVLADIQLGIDMQWTDGAWELGMRLSHEGQFWSWLNAVQLHDLELYVSSRE